MSKQQLSAVAYQGRKTSRTGSERRRKTILEAALRIVIREGVRGVRHRAVAKEAEVPLSATTYYFKDISDLIADTFVLFAENAMMGVVDPLEEKITQSIKQCPPDAVQTLEDKRSVVAELAGFMVAHVIDELRNRREHLLAEQAFMHEALKDERLRGLALQYRQKLLQSLQHSCNLLGSTDSKTDAWLMLTTLLQVQHEEMLKPIEEINQSDIEHKLTRLFTSLLVA